MPRRGIGVAAALFIVAACSTPAGTPTCVTEADSALCKRLGRDCDIMTATDICGVNRSVNCGMCAAPAACGATGTPNLCAQNADAGAPVVDASPDACTWACPTASHWVEITVNIDYAAKADNIYVKGTWLPLLGETLSFLVSFDEGATFKDPPTSQYTARTLISNVVIQSKGDGTGIISTNYPPSYKQTGTIYLNYSTSVIFDLELGANGVNALSLICSPTTLKIGSDQYPILDSFSCTGGRVFLRQYSNGGHTAEYAGTNQTSGTLTYQ